VENTLTFTIEEVIKASGVHPLKVRNVYLYGSRVYGTAREGSDYDIIMIASHLLAHEEKRATVNGVLLNIHIITPDKFLADLKMHNIMNLECLFAPEWAILQEKLNLPVEINVKKLIKNNLAQSYSSWQGGKMKIQKYDFHRGLKSIFHSLRMIMFANQIAEDGKIVDFSVANHLYSEIVDCDEIEWSYFREKYLPLKIELEDKLKSFHKDEQEQNS
jgi:predicted nucleotidyltransferase